jgi:hypothetical protein
MSETASGSASGADARGMPTCPSTALPPPVTPYGAPARQPEGLWPRTRGQAREALRRYGQLTAPWRLLPDYLIIGAKRGGTTSLARWLVEHPEVRPMFPARETRKGAYYFDVNFGRGPAWYRSHFPARLAHGQRERLAGRRLLLGDATPYYLHHPHAPLRARRVVPAARIIVLLRDPVERAHSHWLERWNQGIEWLSFEDALAAEPTRLAGEEARMLAEPGYASFAHQHWSYVDQGRYERGLTRWLAHFGREQVLILRSEDLYEDPAAVFAQVLDFLGLSPWTPPGFARWNNQDRPRIDDHLETWLRTELSPSIRAVERLLERPMGWPVS